MPKVGDMAPDFEEPTQSGSPLKLSGLRGHNVILYFYPKADTPGCTIEAKGFRDIYPQLKGKSVEVVGVSTDNVADQDAFCKKYSLPFPLVADSTKKVATAYGVLRPSGNANRVSFFLDGSGKVVEIVENGSADVHLEKAKARYLK